MVDNPLFIVNHMGLVSKIYIHIKQNKILFPNIFHSDDFSSAPVTISECLSNLCAICENIWVHEYSEFHSIEDLFSRDFQLSVSKEVIMKIGRLCEEVSPLFLNSRLIQML